MGLIYDFIDFVHDFTLDEEVRPKEYSLFDFCLACALLLPALFMFFCGLGVFIAIGIYSYFFGNIKFRKTKKKTIN